MSADPRLLLLTDKFAPHQGGTAVIYREWCDRFPPGSIEVCTCAAPHAAAFDRTAPYSVRRVAFPDLPKVRMPLAWWGIARDAEAAAHKQRPDVLHAGQIIETGLATRRLALRLGVPYFIHCYGEEIHYWNRFPLTRSWMRAILRDAAGVTSISRYTVELLRSLRLYDGPVSLLYPGTNSARFQGADGRAIREQYAPGGGPLLLTVARLLPRKGHDRVLDALVVLRRELPDVRYLIVGAGMTEPALREQVRSLGLEDRVVFVGGVPHGEIPAYFAAADLFVHPNRQLANGDVEGFGIVFLEAGAAGIPVLGGNSGGTPDAIRHGETGYLVDPNNVDEIAGRIRELLQDPVLRRRMGERGREWAAQFTWEAAARQVWEMSVAAVRKA